jgi:hypothetical protein
MALSAAAKIELIETALADGKYRTLQKQLRELRDAQQIILQRYLSDSHESLKAESQRIILELKPIVETQDAIETVEEKSGVDDIGHKELNVQVKEPSSHKASGVLADFLDTLTKQGQKISEVISSLPTGTIVDNSDFGDHINTGTADEKIWLVKKDGNGAAVIFIKTECGQYYETYAGDALRSIVVLGMPTYVEAGVVRTLIAVPDAVRLQENAQKLGLTLHLYDRASDTEIPKDATATEAELPPKFFSLNWQTLNFDSYNKPYPDRREYKPYPNINQLITETKMVGRYGLTALWHPSNHPTADLNELINGGYGLRVACDLEVCRDPYLFHESRLHRILR